MKRTLPAALIGLLALGGLFEAATFFRNFPAADHGSVTLFIQSGSSLKRMANQLHQEGVLVSAWKLRLLARLTGKARQLKPGEYHFNLPTPPVRILDDLVKGRVVLHKATFPEGITVQEVTRILVANELVKEASFRALLARTELPAELGVPGTSFEGFLFPDTYLFSKTEGETKILKTMLERLRQAILPEDEKKAQALNLSFYEWITFASIVEKESSLPQEQPLVSSVFHNRLKKKMRLQSDPTVIYGITNFKGNITRKHLETDTPYNTYTRSGLPPTPIANPGASAIHAAVNPAQTDFFYFVAKKDGTHVFAKTYGEHLRNVAKYQLRRRR